MNNTNPSMNRREIMAALGAVPLAMATRPLRAANSAEVVVIGAGLSGLASALILQDQGLNVQVIEGRDRVGGRVLSYRSLPGNPEAGGTSFGPGYARLVDAAKTHGVETIGLLPVLQYYGQRELFLDGQHVPMDQWADHPRNPFPAQARETPPWRYVPGLVAMNNPLETTDAWADPANASLDISLHDWLKSLGQSEEIINLAYNVEPTHGSSAYDVSALMALFVASFIAAQRALSTPGQSPFLTAKGGNQAIPEAMAAALDNEVHFQRNVVGIRTEDAQAEVHCEDGSVYKADHVICSVPCSVLRRIKIDPVLSGAQALAVNTLDSQIINQAHMVSSEPFWEADGISTNMFSDGLVCNLVGEHKGQNPAEVTSLTAWVRGHKAALLDQMPTEDAKAAIVADLERVRPAAKGKLEIVEYKSWYRDPFSSGDWAVWKPGQVSGFAQAVGQAQGRLHFCGEHTAVSNRGMEGAMESGERVAFEVLEQI